ncbi:MFS transporter [Mangrovibacterium marinum]|uniref:DHA1 family arabinose polymer transporter-like MFS transporter n=1 Tax=Mangrovibacterium marinum TaxID=1639118 RepID=A0A2T5C1Q5_9BACT|nr:MFS transporter [Mangrovibacterium marinum]PTN08542.1 DHA1 family arabinose polymer transporter-like MFS transporter [Mangrovibacterium marinum]
MKKSLLTLSFGTFGLGMAEFVMMGILPYVARDFGVSIPQAGHLISAYAMGVCVGAPLMVLIARSYPLKKILLVLVSLYAVGNFFTALSPNYAAIFVMRFISGLPHGAFFGVGAIVAEKLADKGKRARAMALMVAGMTVANLIGVPLGTFLSNLTSWRLIFLFTGCWGIFNLLAMLRWLPRMDALPNNGLKGQFAFLKNLSPWLLIAATAFANGGVFCLYSYVNPLMTGVAGFSTGSMSWIMVLCGLAMVSGNLLGGRLADKYDMPSVLSSIQAIAALAMTVLFFFAGVQPIVLSMLLIAAASLFAVSSPTQIMLLQNSRGGEMMGAAFLQIAFNMGNALGAWSGGAAIDSGKTVNYTAIIGASYLIVACGLILIFKSWQNKQLIPFALRK